MNIELGRVDEQGFAKGERAIIVDGVRWGRTIVTHRGMHGTRYTFRQEGGEVLLKNPEEIYPTEIVIRSEKKSHRNEKTWRPTEVRVLEMVRELVESGRLRHPDIVEAERKQEWAAYSQQLAKNKDKKAAAFRAKAMEALQINDPESEIINRVVAAMEWAQTQ